MTYSGATHDFLSGLLPDKDFRAEIFSLVDAAWAQVRLPRGKRLEPRITGLLQLAMTEVNQSRYQADPPFSVREDVKIRNRKNGKEVERLDLGVWLRQHCIKGDKPYFVFESKRLNISEWDSNAHEYISDEGMGHLLAGGYTSERDYRGMLGFVMDGNAAKAKQAVEKQLANKSRKLRLRGEPRIHQSAKMPADTPHGETHHTDGKRPSVIFHMFLPVRSASASAP